jgi:hypothetical protein
MERKTNQYELEYDCYMKTGMSVRGLKANSKFDKHQALNFGLYKIMFPPQFLTA